MSGKSEDKINSLRKKDLLTSKDKIKTPEEVKKYDIPERMSRKADTSPTIKNFKTGGRVNAKDGGCIQIKGWGKARKR